ncbi:MAG: molybdopterin-dependent oxidoreductase [Dehalococcoidales bacterium]|nr:molybdopterin-dependent oxidoreductase [Dehalococcoidales bacterium]
MSSEYIRYTSCGYHCHSLCIQKVRIRDGVIVSTEPDDTINPRIAREDGYLPESAINAGMIQTRPCAKGYAQVKMLYDPNRVKYPMKRVGQRGEAKFQRISWDEALDTISGKLVETKKNFGPFSIIHQPYSTLSDCSFPIAPWFGAGFRGWDAHSANGWQEPAIWVLGRVLEKTQFKAASRTLAQDETNIFKSKLIILWGFNPVATLSGGFGYNLLRAKERGIPIICVDYRLSPSVEAFADQWIPVRPTTDVALMTAMANVWFKEDLCDNEFIEKNVEPEGLQHWKNYVLGVSDGTDKTPQWAEGICGVPAETIEAFARLYARSKPVNLNVGLSIGRQFFGENPTRASMYLQALTGNICIPGGTAAAETGLWMGQSSLPRPVVDWQQKPGTYDPPVKITAYKWMKAVDLRERLDKGEISREEYNTAVGTDPSGEPVNIRMAFLETNNHVNSLPDMNANIRAMKKIGFLVVTSHYAENPSARYADILLPQVATAFEGLECQSAVRVKDRFRNGFNLANYFMYRQKCVDPPGECKSSEWVWVQIARRLGLAEQYSPRLANVSDRNWDDTIEALHKEAYGKWAVKSEIAALKPPTWEEFQKKPIFRYEIKEPYYPFKEDVQKGENPFRGTDSGKIELYNKGLAKGPAYLAGKEFFPGSGKFYGPGNLPAMAQMATGGKDNFYSDDSRKYPLLLSSPHSVYRVHSFLDNQPWLKEDCYRHAVWMNVADARARGIKDNEAVRVFNDVGEMVIPAYVTSKIVPGTVCLFHGGWYMAGKEKTALMPDGIDRRGSSNLLTHNEDLPTTVIGYLPCKGLVQVEKWEGD